MVCIRVRARTLSRTEWKIHLRCGRLKAQRRATHLYGIGAQQGGDLMGVSGVILRPAAEPEPPHGGEDTNFPKKIGSLFLSTTNIPLYPDWLVHHMRCATSPPEG